MKTTTKQAGRNKQHCVYRSSRGAPAVYGVVSCEELCISSFVPGEMYTLMLMEQPWDLSEDWEWLNGAKLEMSSGVSESFVDRMKIRNSSKRTDRQEKHFVIAFILMCVRKLFYIVA